MLDRNGLGSAINSGQRPHRHTAMLADQLQLECYYCGVPSPQMSRRQHPRHLHGRHGYRAGLCHHDHTATDHYFAQHALEEASHDALHVQPGKLCRSGCVLPPGPHPTVLQVLQSHLGLHESRHLDIARGQGHGHRAVYAYHPLGHCAHMAGRVQHTQKVEHRKDWFDTEIRVQVDAEEPLRPHHW